MRYYRIHRSQDWIVRAPACRRAIRLSRDARGQWAAHWTDGAAGATGIGAHGRTRAQAVQRLVAVSLAGWAGGMARWAAGGAMPRV